MNSWCKIKKKNVIIKMISEKEKGKDEKSILSVRKTIAKWR